MTDPRNTVTSFSYDNLNRQTLKTEAVGVTGVQRSTGTSYDEAGNVLTITNARGFTTSYAYDLMNRRTSMLEAVGDPAARSTATTYDADNNVATVTDPRGVVSSYAYDALNRKTVAIQDYGTGSMPVHLNYTTTTTYDADNNVASVTDPRGVTACYAYDALNRKTQTIDAEAYPGTLTLSHASPITTLAYDANGNLISSQDPRGKITLYSYDALDRKTQTTDPRGAMTVTAYDKNNNVTTVTDAATPSNVTTFAYDALDRKTLMTAPDSQTSTYAYDPGNLLTSTTDRDSRRSDYGYDALRRLTSETWTDATGHLTETRSYTYDPADDMLTAANGQGNYAMGYDALNRLTSDQEPFGLTLTFSYDRGDNRTLIQDNLGGTTNLTTSAYDAVNRVTSRQFGGASPLREDLTYTPSGQVASVTRSSDLAGMQKVGASAYTYDALDRVLSIQHKDPTGMTVLAGDAYTYDIASRLITQTITGATTAITTYAYDDTNELTSETTSGTTKTYGYDLEGNRTLTGYATGTANRLTHDGTWTYTYDHEGNLVQKASAGNTMVWVYTYDNHNHMVSAVETAAGQNVQATYAYDALDNRLEKDVSTNGAAAVITRFAYMGQDVWADLNVVNNSNVPEARYLRGDAVDQLFARIQYNGANAVPAWYLADHQGSIQALTDGAGVVQDKVTYDAYGNATETNSGFGDRYKYTDREYDTETGLQYNRARYYDASVGRWTTEDLKGFAAGDTNLYRYVNNTPTNATDPSGKYLLANNRAAADAWVRELGRYGIGASVVPLGRLYWYLRVGRQNGGFARIRGDTNANPDWRRNLTSRLLDPFQHVIGSEDLGIVFQEDAGTFLTKEEMGALLSAGSSGPMDRRGMAGIAAMLLLQQKQAQNQQNPSPSMRAPSAEEIQATERLQQRLKEATKELEIQLRNEAYYQRSVHQAYPADSPVNVPLIDWAARKEAAEAAQRRASLSQREQLVLGALEAVMFGLALAATGAEVAGLIAPRGLTGAGAVEFVRANPGSLEEALVEGFESQVGRAIAETERTQLATALQEVLPKAEAELAAGKTPFLSPEGGNPLQLPAPASVVENHNPANIRFSQNTAGGRGRADVLRQSMGERGWAGDPVDAVRTADGITTIDNTRVAVARELGIQEIPMRVHAPTEPLPPDMIRTRRFGDAQTWGEALEFRTSNQTPPLPPTGTPDAPRMPSPRN